MHLVSTHRPSGAWHRRVACCLLLWCAALLLPHSAANGQSGNHAAQLQTATATLPARGLSPRNLVAVGDVAFFTGFTVDTGYELWRTDGTAAGTRLVKDIVSGDASSSPIDLVNVNGTLFFVATDAEHGSELWKSDGTTAGTVLIKDIRPGSEGALPLPTPTSTYLTNVNGTLFFVAADSGNDYELWRSDGTATGTTRVKDIYPGPLASSPRELEAVGTNLFFVANTTEANGPALWKSDGTEAGTVLVSYSLSWNGKQSNLPSRLTNVDGTLFFAAAHWRDAPVLWKSDGTGRGTVPLQIVKTDTGSKYPPDPWTSVNGALVFSYTGPEGRELWRTDGTDEGTHIVADINPRGDSLFPFFGLPSEPPQFVKLGATVFFFADNGDGAHGYELWRTDGTQKGTQFFADLTPGPQSSLISNMVVYREALYVFVTRNDAHEMLKIDAQTGQTEVVHRFALPQSGNQARSVLVLGEKLLFVIKDDGFQYRLWSTEGTDATTQIIEGIITTAPTPINTLVASTSAPTNTPQPTNTPARVPTATRVPTSAPMPTASVPTNTPQAQPAPDHRVWVPVAR